MSPITELVKVARKKRNAAIQAARDEYDETIREISKLARKMGQRYPKAPYRKSKEKSGDFANYKVSEAVEVVLRESAKPMAALEVTLDIQRRGCRPHEDPRYLVRSVRGVLNYHTGKKFSQCGDGRWEIL